MASKGGRQFKLTIDVQFPAILHPRLRYHALLGAARQKLAAIIDGGRECQHRGGHVPIRIGLQNDETKAKQLIALCVCVCMDGSRLSLCVLLCQAGQRSSRQTSSRHVHVDSR